MLMHLLYIFVGTECQKVEQIEVKVGDYFVLECHYNRIPRNPRARWTRQASFRTIDSNGKDLTPLDSFPRLCPK